MPLQFKKEDIKKASRIIRKHIREEGHQPPQISLKDRTGKTRTLTRKQYCGLFDNMANYWFKHNHLPTYTSLLYETNTAYRGNPQPNSWTCGPTSLANASTQVFQYVTEQQCREACQTTKNGTVPKNLITGAKKLGFEVKEIPRTFTAVKKAIDTGYGIIAHIETGGATKPSCLGFISNYGHYINIYDYTSDYKFKVYDPTKGYKVCNAQQIIKATNGRDIKFYHVKALN